ncbi:MAG TPA: hypothetical protein VKY34_07610 [Xanthomarina sp.]|nr:hypothetical protein [Xanthomarina sp.]
MKAYIFLMLLCLLHTGCHGQNTDSEKANNPEKIEHTSKQPKGSWTVNKAFDENGNLIQYDSIYSWSSNETYKDLSAEDMDSVLESFKAKFFKHYSHFEDEGFDDVFSKDSLFSKRFFNDDFFNSDFGQDFMDIDKIIQQMLARQKALLKTYQPQLIEPVPQD